MRKKVALVSAAALMVFTLIAFAVPFSRTEAFWAAFVFGLVAISVQPLVFSKAFEAGASAKSRIYGFPIARIGAIYFVLQLILSTIEMAFAGQAPAWLYLVANTVILALALVGCIATQTARDEVERQGIAVASSTDLVRSFRASAQVLVLKYGDGPSGNDLRRLANAFRYSDPVSCTATQQVESALSKSMEQLQKALEKGDADSTHKMIASLLTDLAARNVICQSAK